MSVGVVYFWGVRILRLLGVAGPVAVIAAGALLASPISVAFYQERFYGFHVELLTPALCLVLFYFLLQRRMIPSIAMALAVISVKEDAPIAAAMVAIVAGVETWISSADKHGRLNYPAMIVRFSPFSRSQFCWQFLGCSPTPSTLVTRLIREAFSSSWRRECYSMAG